MKHRVLCEQPNVVVQACKLWWGEQGPLEETQPKGDYQRKQGKEQKAQDIRRKEEVGNPLFSPLREAQLSVFSGDVRHVAVDRRRSSIHRGLI